jgi:hypothetical protein
MVEPRRARGELAIPPPRGGLGHGCIGRYRPAAAAAAVVTLTLLRFLSKGCRVARQLERRRNVAPRPFWAAARGRSDISGALPGRRPNMIVALSLSKGEVQLRAGRAPMSTRSLTVSYDARLARAARHCGPTARLGCGRLPTPQPPAAPPTAAARWPRFSRRAGGGSADLVGSNLTLGTRSGGRLGVESRRSSNVIGHGLC